MTKKVLVLGGTGAIGVYLVPELMARGFQVDITTRAVNSSDDKNLKYIRGDAHDPDFLKKILRMNKYDVIVDFMGYATDEFRSRFELLLENCEHYIFLSSYRVFADTEVITEKSPRLLDTSTDSEYLKTDEYALAKARQEDILRGSSRKNWTIVRPAITYSQARFQLGTMEADTVVWRTLQKLPIILPREMLSKATTMTWAGDVARLMAKLVLAKKAFGEDFNIATKEHQPWRGVAKLYGEILGLNVQRVSLEKYIIAMGGGFSNYQVKYDRMFDRVLDNTKVLQATGEKQKNFTKLRDGLRRELTSFIKNPHFRNIDYAKQARIDRLTRTRINLREASPEARRIYQELRFPLRTMLMRALRPRTRLRVAKHKLRPRTRLRDLARKAGAWYVRQKYRSTDGAIITLTGYFNYGNIVQRYALQEFLRQKGYKFVSYAREPLDTHGTEFDRFIHTAEFVKKRIWRKPFDSRDDFPTYIVGSDQVWRNWDYPNEIKDLGYYFFDFVTPHAKRIAYASSFGQDNTKDAMISTEFVKFAAPLVKKFNAISVREDSGVEIMRRTWKTKAQIVLDPTMLLTTDDYNKLIRESPHKLDVTNPIFAYIIGVSDKKTKIINKVTRTEKMKVDKFRPKKFDVLPPVEQWLKGFREAELVITDSFHGTALSIINNTPFVVIENSYGGVARITSLLEKFGLESRLVAEAKADEFDYAKLDPIDWRNVNKVLDDLRESSSAWLLHALKDSSPSDKEEVKDE